MHFPARVAGHQRISCSSGSPMQAHRNPVLILGAGINGCALARELALNGVSVWIVDTADIASGATSGSSRLIHGGLRYLEYGEFDLVKESLAERTRLLRLAPQFVRPLRLWIPAENRWGGLVPAVGRFFGWSWWPQPNRPRGSALIRAGLKFYDAYARTKRSPSTPAARPTSQMPRPSIGSSIAACALTTTGRSSFPNAWSCRCWPMPGSCRWSRGSISASSTTIARAWRATPSKSRRSKTPRSNPRRWCSSHR